MELFELDAQSTASASVYVCYMCFVVMSSVFGLYLKDGFTYFQGCFKTRRFKQVLLLTWKKKKEVVLYSDLYLLDEFSPAPGADFSISCTQEVTVSGEEWEDRTLMSYRVEE